MPKTSQSQNDVAPVNVESPPPSTLSIPLSSIFDLTISEPQTQSTTSSVDVELIHTTIVNSPSLNFMEKPLSEIDHHQIDDLLDLSHQISSSVTMCSVDLHSKSIATDSTVTAYLPTSSSSSMDILHPSNSVCPSTDALNRLHQLKVSSMNVSTDDTHQVTTTSLSTDNPSTTVVDHIIAQTLLGLRERCESVERQPWAGKRRESGGSGYFF